MVRPPRNGGTPEVVFPRTIRIGISHQNRMKKTNPATVTADSARTTTSYASSISIPPPRRAPKSKGSRPITEKSPRVSAPKPSGHDRTNGENSDLDAEQVLAA